VDDLAQTMSWLDSQEEKVGAPNEKKACIYAVGFLFSIASAFQGSFNR